MKMKRIIILIITLLAAIAVLAQSDKYSDISEFNTFRIPGKYIIFAGDTFASFTDMDEHVVQYLKAVIDTTTIERYLDVNGNLNVDGILSISNSIEAESADVRFGSVADSAYIRFYTARSTDSAKIMTALADYSKKSIIIDYPVTAGSSGELDLSSYTGENTINFERSGSLESFTNITFPSDGVVRIVNSDNHKIFSTGTSFTNGVSLVIDYIEPSWFGAKSSTVDTLDDSDYLQAAIDLYSRSVRVNNSYYFEKPITLAKTTEYDTYIEFNPSRIQYLNSSFTDTAFLNFKYCGFVLKGLNVYINDISFDGAVVDIYPSSTNSTTERFGYLIDNLRVRQNDYFIANNRQTGATGIRLRLGADGEKIYWGDVKSSKFTMLDTAIVIRSGATVVDQKFQGFDWDFDADGCYSPLYIYGRAGGHTFTGNIQGSNNWDKLGKHAIYCEGNGNRFNFTRLWDANRDSTIYFAPGTERNIVYNFNYRVNGQYVVNDGDSLSIQRNYFIDPVWQYDRTNANFHVIDTARNYGFTTRNANYNVDVDGGTIRALSYYFSNSLEKLWVDTTHSAGVVSPSSSSYYWGLNAGFNDDLGSDRNIGIGYQSLNANGSGAKDYNVAIGYKSLKNNISNYNTAIGYGAIDNGTSIIANTGVGANALGGLTTGDYNISIGSSSALGITDGTKNVIIGREGGGSYNINRSIIIGDQQENGGANGVPFNDILSIGNSNNRNFIRGNMSVDTLAIGADLNVYGNLMTTGYIKSTAVSASLTDGTPTDAEIDSATGTTPAGAGSGAKFTILDSDGTGLIYIVVSDGTNWQYVVSTIAL